jgi:hypothetical protein
MRTSEVINPLSDVSLGRNSNIFRILTCFNVVFRGLTRFVRVTHSVKGAKSSIRHSLRLAKVQLAWGRKSEYLRTASPEKVEMAVSINFVKVVKPLYLKALDFGLEPLPDKICQPPK